MRYTSVNSSSAHPPGQPRGICPRCQSQGWGIRNFTTDPGWSICAPVGDSGHLIHVVSKPCVYVMEAFIHVGQDVNYVAYWLVHQRQEKFVDVFKGKCFLKVTCFFISCIVKHLKATTLITLLHEILATL